MKLSLLSSVVNNTPKTQASTPVTLSTPIAKSDAFTPSKSLQRQGFRNSEHAENFLNFLSNSLSGRKGLLGVKQYAEKVIYPEYHPELKWSEFDMDRFVQGKQVVSDRISKAIKTNTDPNAPIILEGLNLSALDLRGVDLKGAHLPKANFMDSNLSGADFENANLEGAILEQANLTDTKLDHANLSNAYLYDAGFSSINQQLNNTVKGEGAKVDYESSFSGNQLNGYDGEHIFYFGPSSTFLQSKGSAY